ncbi:MAG: MFS transporter, partial [Caldilineaceae bacterium]|nr:MFS transporter [Caldilineaceae bacterium]
MRNPLLLPIYVPTLLLAFCTGMLIPVMPLYAGSFNVSYGLVGLAVGSLGIGTLVGDLPTGVLLGRLGERRTMQIGLVSMALCMFALSQSRSFPELVIYNFLAGVGSALWNISRHMYLANASASGQRGRSIAMFGGINRIGSFLGPVVGGYIGDTFGLGAPFLLYAIVAGIGFLFPTFFAVDHPREPGGHELQRASWLTHVSALWRVARTEAHVLTPAGIGQLFAQMVRSGRQIIVPLYGADMLGLDVQTIGWIVSISSFVDMSLFYPAGFIMDRFGRKFAYVPCFLIQGIGMALIPFTAGFSTLLGAAALMGFGNGLGSGTMMTLGADLAPRQSMGEFLGIWRLVGDVGQTGGPIITGSIADALSLPV